ncbi:hypothetical protein M422DRAFT_202381, partial [Sphaerobolus stellatus SS14]
MSVTELPIELVEKTIGFIDKPSDLLALALACKSFANLVIPDHLDYRIVQCAPGDTQVWQHLIDYPHLAIRIKSVTIPN